MNAFTIKSTDELEQMSAAELAAYEQAVNAQIAALKSAAWDLEMERWMRECPSRMAERDAFNAELAERRAGSIETMPPLTIIAGRAQLAA
jgi:hypothetical protein